MRIRSMCGAIGVGVLLGASAFAQEPSSPGRAPQVASADGTPVTLVGCIQSEADYRRQHNIGRGGAVATGLGQGNEYVLINASKATEAGAAAATPAGGDCSAAGTGEAYELTGSREPDLKPFVGSRVEVTGMMKRAETRPEATGTAGNTTPRPTGGIDPLGRDLQLFEVNVTSFREAPVASRQPDTAQSATPQPVTPRPEPQRTTPPEQPTLPRTASPLPLLNAVGMLSLGAALAIRWRRHARR